MQPIDMKESKPGINLKFVVRGAALGISAAAILALLGLLIMLRGTQLFAPPGPTPVPPTISAPRGDMPRGPIGLSEYAQYRGHEYAHVGSGFLLQLASGDRVGVTTAHSLSLGDADRALTRVAFRIPGQTDNVVEFGTLYGPRGHASDLVNLSMDYVLLLVDSPIDASLLLSPDPRGGPQPGERVSLFSGAGGTPGERYELPGTVMSAGEQAVWILMDKESFSPAMMSGSPVISHHTGQVVGMAVAASPRLTRLYPPRYRILIGLHPIGSIVAKAQAARSFPILSDYQR
jgi:hypothetical protein